MYSRVSSVTSCSSKPLFGHWRPSLAIVQAMEMVEGRAADEAFSHKGLQANVDLISATFGRPVIGVHNKTYGLPFDILECLIQRDFAHNSLDVRIAYDYVKACLCDPTVRKVVLIGHSQGGIIISMVIDELLKDLPQEVFGKVVCLGSRIGPRIADAGVLGDLHLRLGRLTLQQSTHLLSQRISGLSSVF